MSRGEGNLPAAAAAPAADEMGAVDIDYTAQWIRLIDQDLLDCLTPDMRNFNEKTRFEREGKQWEREQMESLWDRGVFTWQPDDKSVYPYRDEYHQSLGEAEDNGVPVVNRAKAGFKQRIDAIYPLLYREAERREQVRREKLEQTRRDAIAAEDAAAAAPAAELPIADEGTMAAVVARIDRLEEEELRIQSETKKWRELQRYINYLAEFQEKQALAEKCGERIEDWIEAARTDPVDSWTAGDDDYRGVSMDFVDEHDQFNPEEYRKLMAEFKASAAPAPDVNPRGGDVLGGRGLAGRGGRWS